jgi:hypothetical protein
VSLHKLCSGTTHNLPQKAVHHLILPRPRLSGSSALVFLLGTRVVRKNAHPRWICKVGMVCFGTRVSTYIFIGYRGAVTQEQLGVGVPVQRQAQG